MFQLEAGPADGWRNTSSRAGGQGRRQREWSLLQKERLVIVVIKKMHSTRSRMAGEVV